MELIAGVSAPLTFNFDDVKDWLYKNFGSHERLPALLEVAYEMDSPDWLALLGEFWTKVDNIGQHKGELLVKLSARVDDLETVIPALMNNEERDAHAAPPDPVTIYRGCGPRNKDGFCWTFDRDQAAKFPFTSLFRGDPPLLLTATVSKHRIAALKFDYGDDHAIVFGLGANDWTEIAMESAFSVR
jgi:hypothetical protein